MANRKNSHESPQVVTLTHMELTNLIKEAVISILLTHGLTKKALLEEFQVMLIRSIEQVVPRVDPEESIWYNATEAGEFIGVSRQTIQAYKKMMVNGVLILEFHEFGSGRIQRITKAACRRAMKVMALRPDSRKKRNEFPERKRKKR